MTKRQKSMELKILLQLLLLLIDKRIQQVLHIQLLCKFSKQTNSLLLILKNKEDIFLMMKKKKVKPDTKKKPLGNWA